MSVFFAILMGAFLLTIFFFQRRLIYFPRELEQASSERYAVYHGLETFPGLDGEQLGWQTARKSTTRQRLVVFHGNGSLALFSQPYQDIAPAGWQLILPEYPGYGTRSGVPTETSIQQTARATMAALQADDLPIYLAGQSLGSAVASWTAATFPRDVAGLLLITPFTELADVASIHYPWIPARWLLRDRFDAQSDLRKYAGPAVFVIAGSDRIIPPALGKRLHQDFTGSKLLLEQTTADHNSLEFSAAWWKPAFDFLLSPAP